VMAAVAAAGLFDHYFTNIQFPHMMALFWLCMGLLVSATRLAVHRADGSASRPYR
jgi:hypothetical protein